MFLLFLYCFYALAPAVYPFFIERRSVAFRSKKQTQMRLKRIKVDLMHSLCEEHLISGEFIRTALIQVQSSDGLRRGRVYVLRLKEKNGNRGSLA